MKTKDKRRSKNVVDRRPPKTGPFATLRKSVEDAGEKSKRASRQRRQEARAERSRDKLLHPGSLKDRKSNPFEDAIATANALRTTPSFHREAKTQRSLAGRKKGRVRRDER